MSEFQEAAILVGLFALRCIAPLLITLALGALMNRLVDRWEADEARLEMEIPTPTGSVGATDGRSPIMQRCWLLKKCDPVKRESCPAYQRPGLPCWLAHLHANGDLPRDCPDCPVYVSALGGIGVV